MDRTTPGTLRQAAVAGLLSAGALACAAVQDPPGGPPDFAPPILVAVAPDSGAVVDAFDDELILEFDEVIQERGLDQLFTISPRHERIEVSWKRRRIGVRPVDGWYDSVAYNVTMRPGLTDLRNNRLDSSVVVTFSTGGAIPATVISGVTIDWENHRIAPRALVEAIRPADSLTFVTYSDSAGNFTLGAVPSGEYRLVATVDQNTNGLRESRESFDSTLIVLDSAVTAEFWMFPHDTVGPRVQQVGRVDSLAIDVQFNQVLAIDLPGPGAARVLRLPDSIPVAVDTILLRPAFDSLRTRQRDSLAALADTIPADSVPADSAVVDSVAPAPTPARPAEAAPPEAEAEPDPARARQDSLLAQRPAPFRSIVVVLREPLEPGERYAVELTATNLLGATETSLRVLSLPPPDEP